MKASKKDLDDKKISIFDFLNSINEGIKGKNLLKDCRADISDSLVFDSADRDYIPFMVNRGLSYFHDTILYANAMNERPSLPVKMQFDFYRHAIRPRKRFSKWSKKADDTEDVKLLMVKYNYSAEKARDALKLYTEAALDELRERSEKGGTSKKKN